VRTLIARFVVPTAATAAVLLAGAALGNDLGASHHAQQPKQYQVTNLSSLGGPVSRGDSINNRSWVAGYSTLAGGQTRHASLWRDGSQTDLGTLGGPNSSVVWPVKNEIGVITGIAQKAEADPLNEDWSCSAFFPGSAPTGHICLGFAWRRGVMRELPTLGGNNGFATGANNRDEVVGWAENTVHDPTCVPPQVLQFRAVVWTLGGDRPRELPLIPGDTSSAATAINDQGQVVGISGICDQAVGRFTAAHAVLWERGKVTDIGNLGANAWNTPMAINQQGDVAGFADTPGDDPNQANFLHAFLWTKHDGIRDLGALPGDVFSEALGINDQGQVVGTSCDANGACRAFLYQDGQMTDLNTLVAPGYTDVLTTAQDINDRGEITGRAFNASTGEKPAFLATPLANRR